MRKPTGFLFGDKIMNLEEKNGVATTTQDVLTHHLNSFGDGDIVSTMADYTAESKFFTPEGLLRGPEAIRSFFVKLFAEFVKPGISFEMLRQSRVGPVSVELHGWQRSQTPV